MANNSTLPSSPSPVVVTMAQATSTTKTGKLRKTRARPEWKDLFLSALRISGNIRAACQFANCDRTLVYKTRDRSPEFRAKFDEAMADAVDGLELEAWRRAKSMSDVLLIFLLKAHRPELYREPPRHIQHSGVDGAPIQLEHSGSVDMNIDISLLSDEELTSLQAIMLKAGAAPAGLLSAGSEVIDGEYSDVGYDDDDATDE